MGDVSLQKITGVFLKFFWVRFVLLCFCSCFVVFFGQWINGFSLPSGFLGLVLFVKWARTSRMSQIQKS